MKYILIIHFVKTRLLFFNTFFRKTLNSYWNELHRYIKSTSLSLITHVTRLVKHINYKFVDIKRFNSRSSLGDILSGWYFDYFMTSCIFPQRHKLLIMRLSSFRHAADCKKTQIFDSQSLAISNLIKDLKNVGVWFYRQLKK